MRHLTLSARVLMWIVLAHTVVVVVAGTLILLNARDAVKLEVLSAQDSAATLVRSAMASADGDAALQSLAAQVAQPRHVRISVLHPTRGLLSLAKADMDDLEDDPAPAWFARWVTPEIMPERIEVDFGGTSGVIEVMAAPDDEAAEVWEDVRDLFLIWIAATALLLVLLTIVVQRSLSPLTRLEHVLNALHSGDLTARVGDLPSRDLQPLGHRIDALAKSLETALRDRQMTDARLLKLRDSERKEIARDLHDELGPCLFAITVEAEALTGAYSARGARIRDSVDRIRALNARVLDAVRPVTIGALPLIDIVNDLIGSFEDQAPEVAFTLDFAKDLERTSESIDLTVYRVIQEAITNALRHGGAENIKVAIRSIAMDAHRTLEICVCDDGCGIDPAWQSGNGLLGMQERVAGIGGRLEVRPQTVPGRGTTVLAHLPMETS